MDSTRLEPRSNPLRTVLLRQAAALREQASALEGLAEVATDSPVDRDEWITAAESKVRFGMGRSALDARGIPKVRKGRAYAWRVSDIERTLRECAAPPPARLLAVANSNADPLDEMLASGVLRKASK